MKCPACKSKRCEPVELENNLKAAACQSCGGHWISHQNYSTWLESHGDTLPEKSFSEVEFDVNDVQAAKLCPECTRILLKFNVGHGLDFFVDHCSACSGIWLDKNEWNALHERNLHDEIHKIFSTSWQHQVRGDHMRTKLDQVYANRFGADAYAKAKDARQWIREHPQTEAILAFLSDEDPYEM